MPQLDIRTITDPYRFQFALPSRFDVAREQSMRAAEAVATWGKERERTKQMRAKLEAGDLAGAEQIHTGKRPTASTPGGEKVSLTQAESRAERLAKMSGHIRPPAKFLKQQQDYDRRLGKLAALVHRVQMNPHPSKIAEIMGEAGKTTPTEEKSGRTFTDAQALNAAAARAKRLKYQPPPSEFTDETKKYQNRLADVATYAMRTGRMPDDDMFKQIMESEPGTVALPEGGTAAVGGVTAEQAGAQADADAEMHAAEERRIDVSDLPDLVGRDEEMRRMEKTLEESLGPAGGTPGRWSIGRGATNMPWTAIRDEEGKVVDVVGGSGPPPSLEEYRHGPEATEEEKAKAFVRAYEAEKRRIEGHNLVDEATPTITRGVVEAAAQGVPNIASGGMVGRGFGSRQHPGWIREPQKNPFDRITNRQGRLNTLARTMEDRLAAFNGILNSDPVKSKYGLASNRRNGPILLWNGEKEVDLTEMLLGDDNEERRKGLMMLARMDRRDVRAVANALIMMGYPPIKPTEEDKKVLAEIAAKPKGQGWRYER